MAKADLQPTDLDLIIVATSSPDYFTPPVSSQVQAALGATNVPAFVVVTGCTGFVYSLVVAQQFIATGAYRSILIVGVELLSRFVDWTDRSMCVLFGDAAGAVVVQATDRRCGVLGFLLGSDGTNGQHIIMPSGGSARPFSADVLAEGSHYLRMNGREVFKFATRVIGPACDQALHNAGLTMNDVDWIIPHQANLRIIQAAAREMQLPMERFVVNIDRYANTSAASIPLALAEKRQRWQHHAHRHAAARLVWRRHDLGGGRRADAACMAERHARPDLANRLYKSLRSERRYLMSWQLVLPNVYLYPDSCNVYAIVGPEGVLVVDAGTGAVARPPGRAAGAREGTGLHPLLPRPRRRRRQSRATRHSGLRAGRRTGDLRRPASSTFASATPTSSTTTTGICLRRSRPCRVAGVLDDYAHIQLCGLDVEVVPLPGVTVTQCGLAFTVPGTNQRAVCCGEAIHSPGRVARVAPYQYNYNDLGGAVNAYYSAADLRRLHPDALLPSLGVPMLHGV